MSFTNENLWLKDFYNSQISHRTRNFAECEAMVKLSMFPDQNSSHLMLASDQDESGMIAPRFSTQFEAGDSRDTLRVPKPSALGAGHGMGAAALRQGIGSGIPSGAGNHA